MQIKPKEFWIVAGLLILTGIYVTTLRYSRISVKENVVLSDIPENFGNWKIENKYFMDQKTLDVLKSSQDVWRTYSNKEGQKISLFVAYFNDQKYGAQIHSPKHCLPGGGWKIIKKEKHNMQIIESSNNNLEMNKFVNSNGRQNELMLYWFWTRSGPITSELGLKIDLAKNSLLRKPTDAAFVRINLPVINNMQETTEIASNFISEIFPSINHTLPFLKKKPQMHELQFLFE